MEITVPKIKAGASSRLNRIFLWTILGLPAVGGGFFCLVGLWGMYQGIASQSWTKVPGTIISSQAEKLDFDHRYEPDVRYSYVWQNKSWVGRGIKTCYIFPNVDQAKTLELIAPYPAGKKVDVFVSSDSPQKTVLEPGVDWSHISVLLSGLFFLTLSALGMWAFTRPERKPSPRVPRFFLNSPHAP